MTRRAAFLALPLAVAALAGCADNDVVYAPGSGDTAIVVFQDGVSPDASYNGTRDAFLKDGPTSDFRNRCYGNVPLDTVGAVPLAGGLYERRLVIKVDLSSITDCGAVLSSSLSIAFDDAPAESITIEVHRVIPPVSSGPWIEGFDGIAGGVSWLTVDGSESWGTEGGDIDGEPLDGARISGDTVVAFAIPAALASDWLAAPASNSGVLLKIAAPLSERFAVAHLRESSIPGLRPRFRIVYLRGG